MTPSQQPAPVANPFKNVSFLLSAARLGQLPPDAGAEVAFAGRSNAGKSSALNTITEIGSLARTSKTPGRTQQINLFVVDETRRLVDLPGYGYAKVPEAVKQQWGQTLSRYLETRACLRGLILLMDIRHPLKEFDRQLLAWSHARGMPVHVLLTKADKLKRGPAMSVLQSVRRELAAGGIAASLQLFSALNRTGVEEARDQLRRWLEME